MYTKTDTGFKINVIDLLKLKILLKKLKKSKSVIICYSMQVSKYSTYIIKRYIKERKTRKLDARERRKSK